MSTANLEVMKQLRAIGASVKLQDDVAKKVGGYDSPLFLPTVEFILKIQQSFRIKIKDKDKGKQSGPLPTSFDAQEFTGVDLDASRDVVEEGGGKKKQKKQSIEYIDSRIRERDDFLDKNPDFDAEKNLIPRRKKDKKQSQQRQAKKSHIISFVANAMRAMVEAVAHTAQSARDNATQRNQPQRQQQQQNVQRQQAQRRNMLNVFRSKRSMLEHAHDHEHHYEHHDHHDHHEQKGLEGEKAGQKPNKDDFIKRLRRDQRISDLHESMERMGHDLSDHQLLNAAKSAKKELGDVSKDLIISKMINDIKQGTHKENGEHKGASKEQMISEAAAKLDLIGVKPITSPEQQINNKKALAEQQQHMADQKQRQ